MPMAILHAKKKKKWGTDPKTSPLKAVMLLCYKYILYQTDLRCQA